MTITLYNMDGSAPCGQVRLLAKHIGVELNLKNIDFMKREHLEPSYLKINPFHKVPTLDDDGFILYEGTPICWYLIGKYAPEANLQPKNINDRAKVAQILTTLSSTILSGVAAFTGTCFVQNKKPTTEQIKELEEVTLKGFEHLIGDGKFAVGNDLTLADIGLLTHLNTLVVMKAINEEKFGKLISYYNRISAEMPYFEEIYGKINEEIRQRTDGLQ